MARKLSLPNKGILQDDCGGRNGFYQNKTKEEVKQKNKRKITKIKKKIKKERFWTNYSRNPRWYQEL